MKRALRKLVLVLIALAVVGGLGYALWPRPVAVDAAVVDVGPLRVTVDEDGQTRIKEKYVVSAPLAGRLARVTLKEGDEVIAGQTVLAAIEPTDPSLLDPRAQAEAQARIRAAEANLERAQSELARVNAAYELAQSELARVRGAMARQAASQREQDEAVAASIMRAQEVRSAQFALEIAHFELEQARAALIHATEQNDAGQWRFEIRAPISGRVLRVFQESAAVVQAGAPLIEVGDPDDLEVVVDVLSRDAVAIRPGAAVILEHWGGEQPLNGRVRLIEPAAYTKVSALGVEEQRVDVVIDFTDPLESREGLGDAYRVEARIVVWQAPNPPGVLKAPTGALFRHAESWAVFAIEAGRAQRRDVQVGRRSGAEAEIVSGLRAGEAVVLYPSDRVQDGTAVAVRER